MKFYFRRIAKWLIPTIIILSIPVGYFIYKSGWTNTKQCIITKQPEEIKGKNITLRKLKEDYFFDYHNMFSSTVRKAMEFPEVTTPNYTISFLKIELEKIKQGKTLHYIIFDNKDNKLIGYVEIREKNRDDPGQFGFWTNENYWGGGRAQEATKLIADTYFKLHPDRQNFIAYVRPWNKRSYYALKKAGFKDVEPIYKDGKLDWNVLEYHKNK
jgi:RimJ/RimL family protein N-acetyltransferase